MPAAAGTLILYALAGACVAAALWLREGDASVLKRAGTAVAAFVFWPIFAPSLFGGGAAAAKREEPKAAFTPRIRIAEEQLLAALSRVEGVAEEVIAPEVGRVRSVVGQMASMERRVEEMDELLRTPEFDAQAARRALEDLSARGVHDDDPRAQSVRARLRNIERLQAMRTRTFEDLERVILKIEEMSSQLQLLKFAGRPDAEVVRLIKDIAESVQGVTDDLLEAS